MIPSPLPVTIRPYKDRFGPILGTEDDLEKQAHMSRGQGDLRCPCRGGICLLTAIPGLAPLTPGYCLPRLRRVAG